MQISEAERPSTGGGWCGSAIKPTHYFSESSSIKVTIKLHKLPDDNDDYNYDIKITYRVWSRTDSSIRYGGRSYGEYFTLTGHSLPERYLNPEDNGATEFSSLFPLIVNSV